MNSIDLLWNELNKKLLQFIRGKVNNIHDAEDLLQDVFVKVYKSIDQLENKDKIHAWIYQITRNTIIDYYKKKKDVVIAPEDMDIEETIEISDNMNDDISKCIEKMLFDLPEKYAQVYTMYEKESMKHKDIAETLDISLSNSKVRLKRAKALFKEKLLNCCEFEVDKYGNIINYHPIGKCSNCDESC